jgi:SAM-dependent methyltransferase
VNLARIVFAGLVVAGLAGPGTAGPVHAQAAPEFKPEIGHQGKDVIWVPTPDALVERMLDMAKVTPSDYVIDLGSGDGRTVIAAARRGARAHGIEYEAEMVEYARRAAAREGVAARATFEKADIFESDFSRAQVITMFLLESINIRLRPKILDLAPGTRIVSNTFNMGDWEPDQTARIDPCTSWCTAHLWIVPAKVEGLWKLGGRELTLRQTYQKLEGQLANGNVVAPVTGRLDGAQVSFTAAGVRYTGRVTGDIIEGRTSAGGAWTATRVGAGRPRG